MALKYHSTRSTSTEYTAKEAILNGIAADGGLYVTDGLGMLSLAPEDYIGRTYPEIAKTVLSAMLDDYTDEEMEACVHAAYGESFASPLITPLVKAGDEWVLELFHGPTSAFKDVALQMLPQLMSLAAAQASSNIMILTATSGDTGKAALAGFANTPGLAITVFYPDGGTSAIQRLQMVTQQGDNVAVAAARGNFDDTQSAVKRIFTDRELNERLAARSVVLSSANSINIGRLAPQVVYYFSAYSQLVQALAIEPGDPVDFCVPTGNFGDVLAGYFAKIMGLPVRKLIVASNANNVLTDFITTGVYDRNRPFYRTISPSMDILISSNLERLLYYACGGDCDYVATLMNDLKETGRYEVSDEVMEKIRTTFACGYATDNDARSTIHEVFRTTNYLLDPHTADAWYVAKQQKREEGVPRVILSTASPFKFCRDVCDALGISSDGTDFDCMRRLEGVGRLEAPSNLARLEGAKERFSDFIDIDDMPAYVEKKCGELL
jgi:threonine synthase